MLESAYQMVAIVFSFSPKLGCPSQGSSGRHQIRSLLSVCLNAVSPKSWLPEWYIKCTSRVVLLVRQLNWDAIAVALAINRK